MIEVKICGITNLADARIVAESGVQALGFIFYPKSLRYIAPFYAREIISKLPEEITKIGVFVNEGIERIKEIREYCNLDLIQLHGNETPEYCSHFQKDRIIKAVAVRIPEDTEAVSMYAVRAILVDTYDPENYGGTGRTAAWELAARIKDAHALILAGGLRKENIKTAIEQVVPHAIDLNSGVESMPGKKDKRKINEILKIISEINRLIKFKSAEIFKKD